VTDTQDVVAIIDAKVNQLQVNHRQLHANLLYTNSVITYRSGVLRTDQWSENGGQSAHCK